MAKIVCIVPRREMADQASLLAANMHIDDFSVIFAATGAASLSIAITKTVMPKL